MVDLEERRGKDEQRVDEQLHLAIYKVKQIKHILLKTKDKYHAYVSIYYQVTERRWKWKLVNDRWTGRWSNVLLYIFFYWEKYTFYETWSFNPYIFIIKLFRL